MDNTLLLLLDLQKHLRRREYEELNLYYFDLLQSEVENRLARLIAKAKEKSND